MLRKGFIKLLLRYREDTLPGKVREALDVWFHTIQKTPDQADEKEVIRERMWSVVSERKDMEESRSENHNLIPRWRKAGLRAASAAILCLLAGYYCYQNFRPDPKEVAVSPADVRGWAVKNNPENTTEEVLLPDGSRVVLEPGGKLRYPASFSTDSRTVYLEGNGFFDVTKDSKRPFVVYSGAVVTRVLGTSFTIKSVLETGGTEVAVIKGKVVVEKNRARENTSDANDNENRIVLTPNKKVTFFENSDLYLTGLVENPVFVSKEAAYTKPGVFVFDDIPLADVLASLEEAYGVEITLSNDDMLECPITADLSSDNLFDKIEIIGAVLNARYEITGSSILLSGGGCVSAKPDHKP